MKKSKQIFKQILAASLVFISRFNFLPANFSMLGSFGFFSNNLFLYFLIIILFDILKSGFYHGFIFNYLGFLAYFVLGQLAQKNLKKQIFYLPIASFLFFLISNLGVFIYWYEHNWQNLLTCYTLALPFYKHTLLGDLSFGYGFLGLKYLAKLISKSWQGEMARV